MNLLNVHLPMQLTLRDAIVLFIAMIVMIIIQFVYQKQWEILAEETSNPKVRFVAKAFVILSYIILVLAAVFAGLCAFFIVATILSY